jgi:malate dehydrogenase (oxaloacetate-decarboxylating)
MVQYRHECRRPRGVYLSIDHPGSMEEAFSNFEAGAEDIDLILATDAEQILGIGDWGVGGIEVTIGKLAIYTAAGGVDPKRVIPVMLDVGTNRESLLTDPMYIGNRHARIRGARYDEFIDEYVRTVGRLFPKALLQWEDLAPGNGRRILGLYRDRLCMFNDAMQGTGAIVLAAAISAVRASGTSMRKQRVVIFGAGTAGMGAADQLAAEMRREGLSAEEALSRFWCVDQQGLLTASMDDQLRVFQRPYARPNAESSRWRHDESGRGVGLAEVMRRVKPTMLIGASGAAGAFTESIVREMAANEDRPIVFVLSSPSGRAEGRGLLATGSSSPPVTYKGVTYVVAHANNALLYPGLGLGAIVSQASRVSDGMLLAAASAVSSLVTVRQPGASLLPQIDDLRSVSLTVAVAVAEAAVVEGLAGVKCKDIEREMHEAMWQPEYRRVVGV